MSVVEDARALPTVVSDDAGTNGSGLAVDSELSETTGAVDKNNFPVLSVKDLGKTTLSATFVYAKTHGHDHCAAKFLAALLQRTGGARRSTEDQRSSGGKNRDAA